MRLPAGLKISPRLGNLLCFSPVQLQKLPLRHLASCLLLASKKKSTRRLDLQAVFRFSPIETPETGLSSCLGSFENCKNHTSQFFLKAILPRKWGSPLPPNLYPSDSGFTWIDCYLFKSDTFILPCLHFKDCHSRHLRGITVRKVHTYCVSSTF